MTGYLRHIPKKAIICNTFRNHIFHYIKLFKQYTHNIAMTLYKINPLRIEKIPLTIKNYPWPCGFHWI